MAYDVQLVATVMDNAPYMILVDGANTQCLVERLDAAAYSVGDRVQITVRTPRIPLVTGKVETT